MVSVTAPRHTKVRSTMQLYLAAVSICDLCRYCIDTEILCARARDLLSFDRSSMSGGSSMCAGPCVDTCVDTIQQILQILYNLGQQCVSSWLLCRYFCRYLNMFEDLSRSLAASECVQQASDAPRYPRNVNNLSKIAKLC